MSAAAQEHRPAPPIAIQAARFVRIPLFCLMTGFTEKAVERKIESGKWIEGRHYRRRDGAILIDMDGYEQWVTSGR